MDLTQDDIQRIMQILDGADFEYFEVTVGDSSMVVSRRPLDGASAPGRSGGAGTRTGLDARPDAPAAAPAAAASAEVGSAAADDPIDDAAGAAGAEVVPAPMVGVFYSAPEPGAAPFVLPGAAVTRGQTIGLIEVMKMFNAVQAPADGIIEECLVESEAFVEYGQALFRLRAAS